MNVLFNNVLAILLKLALLASFSIFVFEIIRVQKLCENVKAATHDSDSEASVNTTVNTEDFQPSQNTANHQNNYYNEKIVKRALIALVSISCLCLFYRYINIYCTSKIYKETVQKISEIYPEDVKPDDTIAAALAKVRYTNDTQRETITTQTETIKEKESDLQRLNDVLSKDPNKDDKLKILELTEELEYKEARIKELEAILNSENNNAGNPSPQPNDNSNSSNNVDESSTASNTEEVDNNIYPQDSSFSESIHYILIDRKNTTASTEIQTSDNIRDIAYEYYKNCFENNDTIHNIHNSLLDEDYELAIVGNTLQVTEENNIGNPEDDSIVTEEIQFILDLNTGEPLQENNNADDSTSSLDSMETSEESLMGNVPNQGELGDITILEDNTIQFQINLSSYDNLDSDITTIAVDKARTAVNAILNSYDVKNYSKIKIDFGEIGYVLIDVSNIQYDENGAEYFVITEDMLMPPDTSE